MTPTKCEDCGEIKALYEVEVQRYSKGRIMLLLTIAPRRWICLECWQMAASDAESMKHKLH